MKKIYFFVAVCLFSCLNLYCDCDEVYPYDEYDCFPRRTVSSFTVDGGLDSIYVGSMDGRRFRWQLTEAVDFEWHSCQETSVSFSPDESDPDLMECGWFSVEKGLNEERTYLIITAEKNVTGKNHHAVVRLNTSPYRTDSVVVYQDCK